MHYTYIYRRKAAGRSLADLNLISYSLLDTLLMTGNFWWLLAQSSPFCTIFYTYSLTKISNDLFIHVCVFVTLLQ